ncbi:MAG: site-specific integrase [Gammaproteobacteria bacterium]
MLINEEESTLQLAKSNCKIVLPSELSVTSWVTNPYLAAATSQNTRRAYRNDIRQYENWGGILPSTPESVVMYLQAFAVSKNSRTLSRRLIALKHWHTYQGFPDPTAHPIVAKTMIGITRTHGKPKDKVPALTPEDLQHIIEYLHNHPSPTSLRDSALLQIGFFGALRRSEIVNIHYEHIKWEKDGIEILLPYSKTDQKHEGQYCAIPYGNEFLCPVNALKRWLESSGISEGAIFRRILRNKIVTEAALAPLSVNHIVTRCARAAKLSNSDQLSPHSLRRGLATSAARSNTPLHVIMRAGRWKQVNTVMEYIEANARFDENAANNVLNKVKENITTK